MLVFPISYIINDCIAEVWGFRKARLIIWSGFAMNFFVVMLGLIAVALPAAPFWDGAAHFNFVFGMAPRIVIASLTAFLVGSFLNAYVMSRMKLASNGRNFSARAIWSTVVGETADSLIFFPGSEFIVRYRFSPRGSLDVNCTFIPANDTLPLMPRMGVSITLNKQYDQMAWLGRGPHENYCDRNGSSFVGLYKGSVAEQYFAYDRPQENGNKTDVRWMSLTDLKGNGLMVIGAPTISGSAYLFPTEDLDEPGRWQIPSLFRRSS